MKRTKAQKGITLIALIITIIVLLILAVVAIHAVQGDGIIAHAKNARDDYNQAQIEENGSLADYLTKIEIETSVSIASTTSDGVPIPKGFYVVGGTKDTGLVISDKEGDDLANNKKGNQFVWVPTTATIAPYGLNTDRFREPDVVTGDDGKKYDAVESNLVKVLEGEYAKTKTAESFKNQLTAEFNSMATSVNKYHGFYVGRYEMSYDGTAKSVKGAPSLINKTVDGDWYGLYAKAKTYTNEANSITSCMIYGSQYNAMMTWMGEKAYTDIGEGYNKNRTTGTCNTDIINNVYDLYGNSYEWTQEVFYMLDSRVLRGGFYKNGDSPNSLGYNYPTTAEEYDYTSSRLALYIK